MNDRDYSELGKEIGEKINKFVNSKEIRDLQDNIKITVEHAMEDVRRSAKDASEQLNKSTAAYRDGRFGTNSESRDCADIKKEKQENGYQNTSRPVKAVKRQLPVIKKPKGRVAGVLMTVFGMIGSISGWAASAVATLIYATGGAISFSAVSGLILGAAAFTAMSGMGGYLRRRAFRFRKYLKQMGNNDFYAIEGFAASVNKNEKFVKKDLKKMIKRGWFKEGHLDEKETCFILTNESYQLYLDAEKEMLKRKEEEERLILEQQALEEDPIRKQLKIAVEEGREYVRRIRSANDAIPGEEISGKLDRLENIGTRIFAYVEENPEKLGDIRKFMNYYLPTTLKLVETYQEFCNQPVEGDNIRTAKAEIEDTLNDINNAFEKMFDKLFENDAMDISTDISVLSAMLAQEGLLENDFDLNAAADEKERQSFAL